MRSGRFNDDEIKRYILKCIKNKPEGVISIIRSKTLRPTLNLMHRIRWIKCHHHMREVDRLYIKKAESAAKEIFAITLKCKRHI